MREPSQDSIDFYLREKQPQDVANKAYELFEREGSKGCTGKVFDKPLSSIAPPFELFAYNQRLYENPIAILQREFLKQDIIHDCYSFIPRQSNDSKNFLEAGFNILSQISNIKEACHIELIAMNGGIHWQVRFSHLNKSLFENSLLSNLPNILHRNEDFILELTHPTNLITFIPHPPYYRNIIAPQSKMNIPLLSLLSIVNELKDDEWFLYRLTIEPAIHSWSKNCQNLYSYEKNIFSLHPSLSAEGNYFINPAFESKKAISSKISPDVLPLFFVSPMIAFKSTKLKELALKSFFNSFRFGDFHYNEIDYNTIGYEKTRNILDKSYNYVEGHLVNRQELAHLFLLPCEKTYERYSSLFSFPTKDTKKQDGIKLGISGKKEIILPYSYTENSIGILGCQGHGKSNTLLSILSQVAKTDSGMIVFYFNDLQFCYDLISTLDHRLDDIIFATPSLNGKILARNLVDSSSMKPIVHSSALAYGLENATANLGVNTKLILKNALLMAVTYNSQSPTISLEDVLSILDKEDPLGKIVRSSFKRKTKSKNILKAIHIIEESRTDVRTVQNKLQDLFDSEDSSEMFSYSGANLLSYKEIIENNKICIWYLGGIGSASNAIASMELSLINEHFLQYGKQYPTPYYKTLLAIDEVQRLKSQAIVDAMRQNRRHGLSFALSLQSLLGVDPPLKEAFDLIGNIISFQATEYDARYVASKTAGLVKSADLMALNKYEMFYRMMSALNVGRGMTLKYETGNNQNVDYVIKRSLEQYYINPENTPVKPTQAKDSKNLISKEVLEQMNYFEED